MAPQQRAPSPAAEPAAPPERPQRFEDVVALATKHRDLPMKHGLERYVRLIRFEPPQIELALTPDAPQSFISDLQKRLAEWTGERWMIAVGHGEPELTLHQQQAAAKERMETDARSDPVVLAVMRHFPGAEIVDIRVRPADIAAAPLVIEMPVAVEADDEDND